MKKILLLIAGIFSAIVIYSQKENFDIASFIPPKGWQRIDSNGVVLFQNIKTNNGRTSFCQIFLFPSQASTGDPAKDFSNEWNRHVIRPTGTKEIPRTETQKNPDGWLQTTGYARISQQGIIYTSLLVAISGFGREMSVLVNFGSPDYNDEVQLFFTNLDMRAPVVTGNLQSRDTPPQTSSGGLSDYVFTAPPGWTKQQYPDRIDLSVETQGGRERCGLTLLPMRNAGANLWTDAGNIFAEVFKGFEPKNDGLSPNRIVQGFSPQGWEYVMIKRSIGMRGYATFYAFVFVAKLGNLIAPIAGSSKDPMVSACFGELMTDVWPKFFYSLQFKNWKTTGPGITKQIAGSWIGGGATAAGEFSFAANGRYADAQAAQQYHQLSSGDVMTSTQAYFGDGSYSLNGNQITLISDAKKNNPEHGYIRVERESIDNGTNWTEKLYLLRKSSIDGKEYEVSMKRNR